MSFVGVLIRHIGDVVISVGSYEKVSWSGLSSVIVDVEVREKGSLEKITTSC